MVTFVITEVSGHTRDVSESEIVVALERARVVGVLDSWVEKPRPHNGFAWCILDEGAPGDPQRFICELRTVGMADDDDGLQFSGATPDAARAAAAKAIETGAV
jgi:hypothetical protein